MCCDERSYAAPCTCGCCGPYFQRRFLSDEEHVARLEAYKEDLQREAAEVEREIGRLKKAE